MTTGEKIRSLRLAKGMTQKDLADRLGVQVPAVYKYESGRVKNLKRSTLETLADALDTDPAYLIGFSDESEAGLAELEEAWEKAPESYRKAALDILRLGSSPQSPKG